MTRAPTVVIIESGVSAAAFTLPAAAVLEGRRRRGRIGPVLEQKLVLELATADGLDAGMERAVELLRRESGAEKVEWWAGRPLALRAVDGDGDGIRTTLSLGPAGMVVFVGGATPPGHRSLARFTAIVRRRFAEEELAREAGALARRNQALEDFAALVAHELKTPLRAALVAGGASPFVRQALELVDSLLESARTDGQAGFADPASSLATVLEELGEVTAAIDADLPPELPLAPTALNLLLRNLVGNAISAHARTIHVSASHSDDSWTLVVDDDGVGVAGSDRYATGSGLGLELSRRLVGRLGGVVELVPRIDGGTRAVVAVGATA